MVDERFEWDEEKDEINRLKHGVPFERARQVFDDPLAATMADPCHSEYEEREITIGETYRRDIVVVFHTQRGSRIRIISARRATAAERYDYMEKKYICDRPDEPDPLDREIHFDPSKIVRGKYYRKQERLTVYCRIDADLVDHFPTNEDLNAALRTIIAEGRAPGPREE